MKRRGEEKSPVINRSGLDELDGGSLIFTASTSLCSTTLGSQMTTSSNEAILVGVVLQSARELLEDPWLNSGD